MRLGLGTTNTEHYSVHGDSDANAQTNDRIKVVYNKGL